MTNAWTEEIDRLNRHLDEIDRFLDHIATDSNLFLAPWLANLIAIRAAQRKDGQKI